MSQIGTEAVAAHADAVAAAVLACPAVVALHAGGRRQVATYLPGRRITGVSLDERSVQVAVVVSYGVPVSVLDQQVRLALAPLAAGREVHLHVADLQLPAERQLSAELQLPATGPGVLL